MCCCVPGFWSGLRTLGLSNRLRLMVGIRSCINKTIFSENKQNKIHKTPKFNSPFPKLLSYITKKDPRKSWDNGQFGKKMENPVKPTKNKINILESINFVLQKCTLSMNKIKCSSPCRYLVTCPGIMSTGNNQSIRTKIWRHVTKYREVSGIVDKTYHVIIIFILCCRAMDLDVIARASRRKRSLLLT